MASKGYGSIPDVEAGYVEDGTSATSLSPKLSPEELQAKYPAANEKEAELLGMLDEVIENSTPELKPPLLQVESFKDGAPREIGELIVALKIPAAAFVSCVAMAFVFIAMNNPLAYALYPYITCITIFLSTVPALRARFSESCKTILTKIDSTKAVVVGQIDGVANKGLGYVDTVENAINTILEPLKEKLDKASKVEKMLQKIDPDIDIPDTSDIEEELQDASDKITSIIKVVKDAVDFAKHIPKAVQSHELFDQHIVYPFLAGCLLIQLISTYIQTTSGSANDADDAIDEANATDVTRQILSNFTTPNYSNSDGIIFDDYNNSTNMTAAEFMDEVKDQWQLISIAFSLFLGAVIQLLICFLVTQKSILFTQINNKILVISSELNDILDKTVKPVFHDVLVVSMSKIKHELLKIIEKIERIEGPMKKLSSLTSGIPGVSDIKMPDVQLPKVDIPKIEVPKFEVPKIKMSKRFGF